MRENDTQGRIAGIDVALAMSLLSRLPVETMYKIPDTAWAGQARAVWAFPLVGALLGVIAAGAGWVALSFGLSVWIAAGLVLATLIVTTGAMHEDGLADCADGFWGADTVKRRLEIMKDSQIGTYGVLALILVTGLRWLGYGLLLGQGIGALIAIAALSRGAIPAVMVALPHARAGGLSRTVGRPDRKMALIGAGLGFGIAVICLGWAALPAALVGAVAAITVALIARRKINGQTGDVLGAVQQIAELAVILVLIA